MKADEQPTTATMRIREGGQQQQYQQQEEDSSTTTTISSTKRSASNGNDESNRNHIQPSSTKKRGTGIKTSAKIGHAEYVVYVLSSSQKYRNREIGLFMP